ncbi:tetratricopeptide repeat protein [Kroppenstedtia eburnea]|uniref:tetratricopeptide repeat protein n=1 Tax=Kroppenstedtia eburnea TaxID=714067 RepID=UPI0036253E38
MNKKRQGEWIRDTYQVLQSFPFVQGVLYYVEIPSRGRGELLPETAFVHAMEQRGPEREPSFQRLLQRDSLAFSPLKDAFVEEGIFYQVFSPLDGTLLAYQMLGSELLPLGEVAGMLKRIADQLLRLRQSGEFTIVHPQNILLTPDGVRFLYGGPSGLIPGPAYSLWPDGTDEPDETREVYLWGALAYTLFTGVVPNPGEMEPLHRYRKEVPVEWERLILNSLRADPAWRPRLAEIREGLERVPALTQHGTPAVKDNSAREVASDLFSGVLLRTAEQPGPHREEKVRPEGSEGEEAAKGIQPQPLQKTKVEPSPRAIPKRKSLLFTGIGAVVIGLVAGVYLLFSGGLWGDDAEDAARYYGESVRLFREKQMDEAITRAQLAVEADPAEKEYLLHLANLHAEKKDYKKATQVLAEGVKNVPDPGVYDALAMYALDSGDLKQAESAVQKALSSDRENPLFHYHEGKIHGAKGDDVAAVRSFRTAVRLNPKEGSYHYILASYLLKLKKTEDAVKHGQEAAKLKPDNATVWYKLGQAHLAERERIAKKTGLKEKERESLMADTVKEATQAFNQVIKLKPEHAATHYYLSIARYYAGDFEASLKSARESVRISPKTAVYHFQHGVVLQRLNKREEAAKSYRKAQELDPGDIRYKEALDQIK